MKVNEIIPNIISQAQANPLAAAAAGFILIILLVWRPKVFFILLGIAVAGIGVLHLFAKLSATGLDHAKIPFMD